MEAKASGVSVRLTPIGSALGVKLFDQTGTEVSSTVLSVVNGQLQVTTGTKAQLRGRQASMPSPSPTPYHGQGNSLSSSGDPLTATQKARLDAIARLLAAEASSPSSLFNGNESDAFAWKALSERSEKVLINLVLTAKVAQQPLLTHFSEGISGANRGEY